MPFSLMPSEPGPLRSVDSDAGIKARTLLMVALVHTQDPEELCDIIFAGHDETDLRREEVYPGVRRFV